MPQQKAAQQRAQYRVLLHEEVVSPERMAALEAAVAGASGALKTATGDALCALGDYGVQGNDELVVYTTKDIAKLLRKQ